MPTTRSTIGQTLPNSPSRQLLSGFTRSLHFRFDGGRLSLTSNPAVELSSCCYSSIGFPINNNRVEGRGEEKEVGGGGGGGDDVRGGNCGPSFNSFDVTCNASPSFPLIRVGRSSEKSCTRTRCYPRWINKKPMSVTAQGRDSSYPYSHQLHATSTRRRRHGLSGPRVPSFSFLFLSFLGPALSLHTICFVDRRNSACPAFLLPGREINSRPASSGAERNKRGRPETC